MWACGRERFSHVSTHATASSSSLSGSPPSSLHSTLTSKDPRYSWLESSDILLKRLASSCSYQREYLIGRINIGRIHLRRTASIYTNPYFAAVDPKHIALLSCGRSSRCVSSSFVWNLLPQTQKLLSIPWLGCPQVGNQTTTTYAKLMLL